MYRKLKSKPNSAFKNETGANLVEWSLLASLVMLMAFTSVQYFGREVELKFADIDLAMSGGNGWVNRGDGTLWLVRDGAWAANSQWEPVW